MVFSSLVFLWVFLPITLITYFLARKSYRNLLLLIASLIFYAWGEPFYVFIMIASIIVNYYFGIWVDTDDKKKSKFFLFWGVVVNLAVLGLFKYSGFFTENVNAIFGLQVEIKKLPLPIGISFYTFQSISYLVDIYRRQFNAQRNILKMGLFIALFPPLIAGPILRYYDIAHQIDKRSVSWAKFNEGSIRFIQGLAKKIIIANIMAKTADDIFALGIGDVSTLTAWIGIIAYTFQIYFDFSGYSEMAIGLGKMFGFDIDENFNKPYVARSIQDFWRRWHISLSTWFKEYLYIPLGGNREGSWKTYRNLLIVFFTTGLWHGASWNFVVWGLFHGFFIVFERIVKVEKILRYQLFQSIYAMLVVVVGWVFFRANDLSHAVEYLGRMFGPYKLEEASQFLTKEVVYVGIIGFLASGFLEMFYNKLPIKQVYKDGAIAVVKPAFLVLIAYLSVLMLANSTYNPFIYFRF